jgi:ABC-2 type transport system permease protein
MTSTIAEPGAASGARLAAMRLRAEVVDELRAIVREPTALFFSIVMPVGFFTMFAGIFGSGDAGGMPIATRMLATFGTFAVVSVALFNPGISLADARERGWLRMLRVSPVPVPVTLAAKIVATLPYSLLVMVAMTAAAAALGSLAIALDTWLLLVAVLVLGTLPFAFASLAIGSLASPNAATAILNAILLPSAVASGLWFPLETLPTFVQRLAPILPTYHLAQMGTGVLDGGGWLPHAPAIIVASLVTGVAAVVAYRRAPS